MINYDVLRGFESTFSSDDSKTDIIESSIRFLKHTYGVSAIGVRLREGNDYPYYTTIGFSDIFIRAENFLCERAKEKVNKNSDVLYNPKQYPCLECMCGIVISEHTDDSLPYFRSFGSFYTGSTTKLLSGFKSEERKKFRNRCNTEGYETVLLVPLKYNGYNIGLLQVNDIRVDVLSQDDLDTIEAISLCISSAVGFIIETDKNREQKQELLKSKLFDVINDLRKIIDIHLERS